MGKFSFLNVAAVRRSYQDFMTFRFLIQLQVALQTDLKANRNSYSGYKVDLPNIISLATQELERIINDEAVTATDKLDLINQYSHLNSVVNSLTKALNYNFNNNSTADELWKYLHNLTSDSLNKVTLAIEKGYFDHDRNAVYRKLRESVTLSLVLYDFYEVDIKKSSESAAQDKQKIERESSNTTNSRSYGNSGILRCIKCNQSLNIPTGRKILITCPVCKESWLHSP